MFGAISHGSFYHYGVCMSAFDFLNKGVILVCDEFIDGELKI